MATQTLYRPIGTAEAALIAERGWKSFPRMPDDYPFYVYNQPLSDPREWPAQISDIEFFEYLESGQELVVESWKAWGNAPDRFYVVWFDIEKELGVSPPCVLDVNLVNQMIVGDIEICTRYGPTDIWIHPRLRFDLNGS